MAEAESLLQMRGIVKTFPGVRALDGVDLEVRPGEVHCLLGQNGAGKSTLIKVLAGVYQPDDGEIRWNGEPVSFSHPTAAIRQGVGTIYQELDLVDGLSVTDNVFLGHEIASAGISLRNRSTPQDTRHPCSARPQRDPPGPRGCSALRRQQAGREHGARNVARVQGPDHGRAFGGARPGGGPQPLPGHPRPDPRRRRRHLHLAPARGDSGDR